MTFVAEIIGHVEVDFVASRDAGKLRLWAVDLSMSPTVSLSGFQLFDFLAAGQFDPATGTYWVPGMPGTPDTPAAMAPNQSLLQQSEAVDSVDAVESQQHARRSSVQPFEENMQQDAVAVEKQGGSHQLPLQTAELNSVHAGQQQSSVSDQRPSSAMGADEKAAECREDAAVGASTAVNAASMRMMNQSPDNDLESDLAEAEAESAPNFGNNQEQSMAEVGSMSNETMQQVQADSSSASASAWQHAEAAMVHHEVQLEPRFYAAIDLLFHSGMHKRRSAEFLQSCRVAGLGFDMMARQGLVLNFMDSMSSCCLGVQCAGPTPQLALQGLSKVMTCSPAPTWVSCLFALIQLPCICLCCRYICRCMLYHHLQACLPVRGLFAIEGMFPPFTDSWRIVSNVMCFSWDPERLDFLGMQALSFMLAQFGETGLDGRSKQSMSDPDAENFRNIYATIRFLADRVT